MKSLSQISGREVLQAIQARTNVGFPKSGFVAGGAVAGTIWEMVYGRKIDYSDVDVFTQSTTPCTKEYVGPYTKKEEKLPYVMLHSTQNGLLNIVEGANRDGTAVMPQHVLDNFDLNCTKVGVDIQTQELIMNPHFIGFMQSKEIHVSNAATPVETILRGYAKSDQFELPLSDSFFSESAWLLDEATGGFPGICYGTNAARAALLAVVKQPEITQLPHFSVFSKTTVSSKNINLFHKYKQSLLTHFHAVEDHMPGNPGISKKSWLGKTSIVGKTSAIYRLGLCPKDIISPMALHASGSILTLNSLLSNFIPRGKLAIAPVDIDF